MERFVSIFLILFLTALVGVGFDVFDCNGEGGSDEAMEDSTPEAINLTDENGTTIQMQLSTQPAVETPEDDFFIEIIFRDSTENKRINFANYEDLNDEWRRIGAALAAGETIQHNSGIEIIMLSPENVYSLRKTFSVIPGDSGTE